MYFVTFQTKGKTHMGVLTKDKRAVIPLQAADAKLPNTMIELLEQGEKVLEKVRSLFADTGSPKIFLSEVRLLAPIPRPRKNIFCVGKNYYEHAMEFGTKFEKQDAASVVPPHPVLFSKVPTSVIGPNDVIDSHSNLTSQLDYEVELAVVIGKKGVAIPQDKAMDYVFGYTIINDVTARELQKKHNQWLIGKGLDTFCPMGPYLTHKSAVSNIENLAITLKVNGELRQSANTGQLIFKIPEIIATLSAGITLEPGDIIATGTPAGVGLGFNPTKFLKAGDLLELEIGEIGILKNTVG
jgi:2-keto-4-pentenoate hydratase/2-oxohepta-3-ene-1,7-dioic acid hydratase in catechol pathway